jgi:hypothetical protein
MACHAPLAATLVALVRSCQHTLTCTVVTMLVASTATAVQRERRQTGVRRALRHLQLRLGDAHRLRKAARHRVAANGDGLQRQQAQQAHRGETERDEQLDQREAALATTR